MLEIGITLLVLGFLLPLPEILNGIRYRIKKRPAESEEIDGP